MITIGVVLDARAQSAAFSWVPVDTVTTAPPSPPVTPAWAAKPSILAGRSSITAALLAAELLNELVAIALLIAELLMSATLLITALLATELGNSLAVLDEVSLAAAAELGLEETATGIDDATRLDEVWLLVPDEPPPQAARLNARLAVIKGSVFIGCVLRVIVIIR